MKDYLDNLHEKGFRSTLKNKCYFKKSATKNIKSDHIWILSQVLKQGLPVNKKQ